MLRSQNCQLIVSAAEAFDQSKNGNWNRCALVCRRNCSCVCMLLLVAD